jgi:hypothetical protein
VFAFLSDLTVRPQVGTQEMEDLNVEMKVSPDSMKYLTEAQFPPCDLGGAKLHTYFKRRSIPRYRSLSPVDQV